MKSLNLFVLISIFFVISCKDKKTFPKPTSYLRIDFPEKNYYLIQDSCPFIFKTPEYSAWKNRFSTKENCNKTIIFPAFKAEILCDYITLDNNLIELSEAFRKTVYEHSFKSSAIIEKFWTNETKKVYGIAYEIRGNTACNFAFCLTDSMNHFFSGQLLFQTYPNYDSLKPSIGYIKNDIDTLISSFKWTN